jgi:hypothetical protein
MNVDGAGLKIFAVYQICFFACPLKSKRKCRERCGVAIHTSFRVFVALGVNLYRLEIFLQQQATPIKRGNSSPVF